jgi:hypothetical protein
MFKSAKLPLQLTFRTESPRDYVVRAHARRAGGAPSTAGAYGGRL